MDTLIRNKFFKKENKRYAYKEEMKMLTMGLLLVGCVIPGVVVMKGLKRLEKWANEE